MKDEKEIDGVSREPREQAGGPPALPPGSRKAATARKILGRNLDEPPVDRMMRKGNVKTRIALKSLLFALFASFAFFARTSQAATVTGTLRDTGISLFQTSVTFTPTNNVLVTGSALTAGPAVTIVATNGVFTNVLDAGFYTVSFPFVPSRRAFRISVPNSTNTFNISALMDPAVSISYPLAAFYAKASEDDTTPGSLTNKLVAGDNVTLTLTTDGTNKWIVISSTGTGGGGSVDTNALISTTAINANQLVYAGGKLSFKSGAIITNLTADSLTLLGGKITLNQDGSFYTANGNIVGDIAGRITLKNLTIGTTNLDEFINALGATKQGTNANLTAWANQLVSDFINQTAFSAESDTRVEAEAGLRTQIASKISTNSAYPIILLIGDSRSPNGSGWPVNVRTNAAWDNRAAWIGTAVPGKQLAAYSTNFDNEILPYLTGVSNQVWASVFCGVNGGGVQTNQMMMLWTNLIAHGIPIIQFASGVTNSDPAERLNQITNDLYITSHSSLFAAFVNATNFSSDDNLHPNAGGAAQIADLFVAATTNVVPRVFRAPFTSIGEAESRASTSNEPISMRSVGHIVADWSPRIFPNGGFLPGFWLNDFGSSTQTGVSYDPYDAKSEMDFWAYGRHAGRLDGTANSWFGWQQFYISGDDTTTDKQFLWLFGSGGSIYLSSQAAGAYGFAPIILKSGNTALTVDHTNGISTTNTLTLRDVNVTGTASGQDATALTNFVTLAQLNTKQPASTVVSNLAAASPAVGFLTNNGASGVGWLPGSILLDFATNNYTSTSNLLVTMTNAGTAIIFLTNSISNVTFTNAGKQDVIFIAQTDSTIFFNTNNHFASTNGFTIVASKYSTAITNGQHGYLSVTRFLDSQAGCAIGYKLEEGR